MLKLIIEDDEGRKTVVPFVRDEITIGRQEGNTIRLTERNVSRRHARLVRQNGHVLVEDLGSYNGIRINGDKIQGQVPVHEGDLIQIGDYDLAVKNEQTQPSPNDSTASTSPLLALNPPSNGTDVVAAAKPTPRALGPADAMTIKLPDLSAMSPTRPLVTDSSQTLSGDEEADSDEAHPALGEPDSSRRQSTAIIRIDQVEGNRPQEIIDIDPSQAPRLVVLNTEFAGREFACVRTELKIGRTEDNDIALDHRSLSRTHCKIVRDAAGQWRAVDLQSANGLLVNGEPYAQSALRTGDTLELGHVKFKFVGPGKAFTLSASSEGVEGEDPPNSRAPLYGTVAAVLVALVGGGYWLLRKPSVETAKVEVRAAKENTPTAPLTPEQLNRATEKKLTEARLAIEALDWKKAEEILHTCRIDESACPEATVLLAQMHQEKGYKIALQSAEAALDANNLPKAKVELEMAMSSKLLAKRFKLAEARFRQDVARELGAKPTRLIDSTKGEPTRGFAIAPRPAIDVSAGLLEEGKRLFKDKQYPAAKTQLEKCIKVAPRNADCHKLLGTTWAKLQEYEKGAREYKEFLKVAPKDHPDIDKVKEILYDFENQ